MPIKRMNFLDRMEWFAREFGADLCWEWPGAKNYGYGAIGLSINGKPKMHYAHRVAWEAAYGHIPKGEDARKWQLDHLCRNRACFNPNHLELVTQQENIRRGDAGIHHKRKTHCKHGHPFDGPDARVKRKANGRFARVCLVCKRASYHRNR